MPPEPADVADSFPVQSDSVGSPLVQRGATEVLLGVENGKYPHGNTVVVRGSEERILIDPSLSLWESDIPEVDRVILTHVHEDHVAGLARFPDTPVAANERDAPHLRSVADLLEIYGLPAEAVPDFEVELVESFHFAPRPDVESLADDVVLDLGGGTTVTGIPTPGHTAGHTAYLIEPDGVLVIGDIDLTGFGPYYGDATSSLTSFVDSIERIREIDAGWVVTFHLKAVFTERSSYLEALDAFAAVIDRRDGEILEFLAEPHTMAEMVAHRFLYRPHVVLPWVDSAEERTTRQHLARMEARGQVERVDMNAWRAV